MNMVKLGVDPFLDPTDRFLAEIAFSIQLPPSLHKKAVERYEAVRKHLEASVTFANQIEHFYPQGSMAIDATISTRGTDSEYDIDIIAQLGSRFHNKQPLDVLLELEKALQGYQGLKVIRQTRCVTLDYGDSMHLDVSSTRRRAGTPDRWSDLMHAKGPQRSPDDHLVATDAYGFAQWYIERTPVETRVVEAFRHRWQDAMKYRADADADDVPEQTIFVVKNMATLALQLVKRYRNISHEKANRTGRMPPSVMLACYAARSVILGLTLTEALINLCNTIIRDIELASRLGRLLHVVNPTFNEDVFTDRWPENIIQQNVFAAELGQLVTAIERIRSAKADPADIPNILRSLFGDRVVTAAVRKVAMEGGSAVKNATQSYTKAGRLILPTSVAATPALAAPKTLSSVAATSHRFYGDVVE